MVEIIKVPEAAVIWAVVVCGVIWNEGLAEVKDNLVMVSLGSCELVGVISLFLLEWLQVVPSLVAVHPVLAREDRR